MKPSLFHSTLITLLLLCFPALLSDQNPDVEGKAKVTEMELKH